MHISRLSSLQFAMRVLTPVLRSVPDGAARLEGLDCNLPAGDMLLSVRLNGRASRVAAMGVRRGASGAFAAPSQKCFFFSKARFLLDQKQPERRIE